MRFAIVFLPHHALEREACPLGLVRVPCQHFLGPLEVLGRARRFLGSEVHVRDLVRLSHHSCYFLPGELLVHEELRHQCHHLVYFLHVQPCSSPVAAGADCSVGGLPLSKLGDGRVDLLENGAREHGFLARGDGLHARLEVLLGVHSLDQVKEPARGTE